ncbi:hypothetical protein [Streptomyces sp. CB02414]|nr:hypothetical protein [Streptomyces sp. CB02414]
MPSQYVMVWRIRPVWSRTSAPFPSRVTTSWSTVTRATSAAK